MHWSLTHGGRAWAPPGRFGWKFRHSNPFKKLVDEADALKERWPPLQAGFFNGRFEEFHQAAVGLGELLSQLKWF